MQKSVIKVLFFHCYKDVKQMPKTMQNIQYPKTMRMIRKIHEIKHKFQHQLE